MSTKKKNMIFVTCMIAGVTFAFTLGLMYGDDFLYVMNAGFDVVFDNILQSMILLGVAEENSMEESSVSIENPFHMHGNFTKAYVARTDPSDAQNSGSNEMDGTGPSSQPSSSQSPSSLEHKEYIVNGKSEHFIHVSNGTKKSIHHYYAKAPPCSIHVNSNGDETRMMFGFATGIPRSNQMYGNSPDTLRIFDQNEAVAMGFTLQPCKYDKNGNGLGDGWEDHDGDGYADGFKDYKKRGLECMKPYGWHDGWWIRATSLECVYGPPGLASTIVNRQQEIQNIKATFPNTIPSAFLAHLAIETNVMNDTIEPASDVSQKKSEPPVSLRENTPALKPKFDDNAPLYVTPIFTPIPRPIPFDTATTSTVVRILNPDIIQVENDLLLHLTLVNAPQYSDDLYEQSLSYTRKSCPQGTSIIYDIDDGYGIQNTANDKTVLAWCIGYGSPIKAGPPVPLNELLLSRGLVDFDTQKCKTSEFGRDEWSVRSGC